MITSNGVMGTIEGKKPLLRINSVTKEWIEPADMPRYVDVDPVRCGWPFMRAEYVGLLPMRADMYAVVRPAGHKYLQLVHPSTILAIEEQTGEST